MIFLWILVSRPQKGPPHARCKFTQPFLAHITSRYRDELWRRARIFWPYMRSWADRTRGSQACTDDKILGCCEGGKDHASSIRVLSVSPKELFPAFFTHLSFNQ